MEKSKKEKLKTSAILALIVIILGLCTVMGVQAVTNAQTTKFSMGTRFESQAKFVLQMQIDSNWKTIYNSTSPTSVDYSATYIDSITSDTIFLKNQTLSISGGIVSFQVFNYDTVAKLKVYIKQEHVATVAKAADSNTPTQSQILQVNVGTIDQSTLLGTVLISLQFEIAYNNTVTFINNNGLANTTQDVEDDSTIILPTPTYNGYVFKGWYINPSLTTPFNPSTIISADITLYAKWAKLHTITFVYNNNSANTTTEIEDGQTLTLPADPTYTGHIFKGWYINSNFSTQFSESTPIVGDQTLYAKWQECGKLSITFSSLSETMTIYTGATYTRKPKVHIGYDLEIASAIGTQHGEPIILSGTPETYEGQNISNLYVEQGKTVVICCVSGSYASLLFSITSCTGVESGQIISKLYYTNESWLNGGLLYFTMPQNDVTLQVKVTRYAQTGTPAPT